MKTILGYLLIGVLFVTVLAAVLLFTPLGERPLSALFSIGDIEAVNFSDLRLTDKPNQFLMCPPHLCNADRHADSPVFDVSVDQLRERDALVARLGDEDNDVADAARSGRTPRRNS